MSRIHQKKCANNRTFPGKTSTEVMIQVKGIWDDTENNRNESE